MSALVTIQVNGQAVAVPSGQRLITGLEQLGYDLRLVALEFNGEILHRQHWLHTRFQEGDVLEVVTIVGGGGLPQAQDSSPEKDNGGQKNGRTEDGGAAVVAGCKTPPALQSGKERLDFVAPALQPLVVIEWFLRAATGQDARHDALLDQHLTDFVPVIS